MTRYNYKRTHRFTIELLFSHRIGSFLYLISPVFRRFNTERPHSSLISHSIKFLVDSGSDVVTLRPDVIQNLKLDQIGIAKQTGAGGRVIDTRIYSACLEIGGKVIPVEVSVNTVADPGEIAGGIALPDLRQPTTHFH